MNKPPSFTRANSVKWSRAAGVASGHYAWCVPLKSDRKVAHAYKTSVRAVQGLCGASLKGGIGFPGTEASACEKCWRKAEEMEQMLARTDRKDRDAAGRLVLS